MKTKKIISRLVKKSIPILLSISMLAQPISYANPAGGTVTAGSGSISQNGNTMTINQNTNKMAINWQSFNINSGEKVIFKQPGITAIALNRVIGNNPSNIYGQLISNGKVFLINPNGILFAPGSQVNVGGLVASTMNISDNDFMTGKYKFNGKDGFVINQGTITASDGGYVALLGSQVKNEGIIIAQKGTVALGAGNVITLDMYNDGLLNIAVDQNVFDALVENKNLIQADGGQVIMTANAANILLGTTVNNSGMIQARNIEDKTGSINLDSGSNGTTVNSGILDVSGKNNEQTGGTIKVLGDKVEIKEQSLIDASGSNGGGTILVGGNYQGKGTEINASTTYVDKNTTINADALDSGDGGKVVIWADDTTTFEGQITARGGEISGNGGNVEVSGKEKLSYKGFTDLRAPNGKTGNLLLDPTNYVVAASGGDITGVQLSSQLSAANVTISSNMGSSGSNGDILVNDNVSWNSDNSLSLVADRNVYINANVTTTGNNAGLSITHGSNGDYNLGKGTKITLSGANPWLSIQGNSYNVINSLTALQNINNNLSGYYALGTDINASATSTWNNGKGFIPIGGTSISSGISKFSGIFEGNGHKITDLTINDTSLRYVGLFGYTYGTTIRNINLLSVNINGGDYTGGLIGSHTSGLIDNVHITGQVTISGGIGGGIVGSNNLGTINNSHNEATVTGINNAIYVGGIAGDNVNAKIINSYNSGTISSFNSQGVGGIAGTNQGGSSGLNIIINSYNVGKVIGSINSGYLGGIGGIVGSNFPNANISNSYNAGIVTATNGSPVGGLAGYNQGTISNSYWDIETSGQTTSAGGIGLTTLAMKQKNSYNGWDFADIWQIDEGNSYPTLKALSNTSTNPTDTIDPNNSDNLIYDPNYLAGLIYWTNDEDIERRIESIQVRLSKGDDIFSDNDFIVDFYKISDYLNYISLEELKSLSAKEIIQLNRAREAYERYLISQGIEANKTDVMSNVHMLLDGAGFIFPFTDGINAVVYLFQGDFDNAGLSALSIVPIGDVLKLGKVGKAGVKYIDGNAIKGAGSLKISNSVAKHIDNGHNPNTYAKQLQYKPQADVLKELEYKSFFNSNWSSEQIQEAINYGYNQAVSKGLTGSPYTFTYAGETVTVVFENGVVQSAWGNFKYTYEQLLNLIK